MKLFCIFISTMAFGGMLLTSCGEKKEAKVKVGDGGGEKEQAAGGSEEKEQAAGGSEEKEQAAGVGEEKEQAAGVGDKANEGDEGEKAAVAAFIKELEDRGIVEAFGEIEELGANAGEDPIPMFKAIEDLDERLKPLVTDGLPADLKQAFDMLKSQMNDMSVCIKAMPMPIDVFEEGEAALTSWVLRKAADDPEFLAKFQKDMGAWETKMTELGSKMEESDDELREVFEKYSIEGLDQSLKDD